MIGAIHEMALLLFWLEQIVALTVAVGLVSAMIVIFSVLNFKC